MESEVTHSADFYRLWAWFEKNRKQVTTGATIAVFLGIIIWFFVWRQGEKAAEAGAALSKVYVPQAMLGGSSKAESPEAFLKVASDYAGSKAAEQALLMAAGALFTQGKFAEAQARFDQFKREHRDSVLMGPALLGSAASLEAQGKTPEAIAAYKDLVDHHPAEPVVPQAKFALGRLYEAQNKPELALVQYEDVVRNDPYGSSMGNEAAMRAEELKTKYPALAPKPEAPPTTGPGAVAPKPAPSSSPNAALPKAPAETPKTGPAAPSSPQKR